MTKKINRKKYMDEINKIKVDIDRWKTDEVYASCIGFMDLTSLNSTDTDSKIVSMIDKVNAFRQIYPKYPQVAAICLYPNFTALAKSRLKDSNVNLAVVAALFPSSQGDIEVKVHECKKAVEDGAREVDIVLSLRYFLAGDMDSCSEEIRKIKSAIGNAHLKVILETGAIKDPRLIYSASMLSMEAGADFIKTSTGKMEPAATPEAAYVMCSAIKDFMAKSGKKIGFKPAGGIVTPEDAALYYAIVDTVLGKEWLNSNLFRIGASRLANNLLTVLEGKEVLYY